MFPLKKSLKTITLLLLATMMLLPSCKDDEEVLKTEFTGEKVAVGDGYAWSYVKTDESGTPVSVAVQFDEKALDNLPAGGHHNHMWTLAMPADIDVAPYDHIGFDWNSAGHEPPGVYDLPHFDFHFYFVSEAELAAVDVTDTTAVRSSLPAKYMPPMYLDTKEAVPNMGVHLIDLLSPEIAGTGTFTKTLIYGKYDGKITFIEPMITLDYIKSRPGESIPIRQPLEWMEAGHYPASYSVKFDAVKKVYTVAMEGLSHAHL